METPTKPSPMKSPCSKAQNACRTTNCRYCPLLDHSGRITSSYSQKTFICRGNVTCKSNNLVYCVTSKTCKKQYIGQTGGSLMDWFKAHFGVIGRRDMKDDIGRHFNSANHHGTADMGLHILDFIYAPQDSGYALDLRLQIEHNWIQSLQTMMPFGLNTMDKAPKAQYCRDIKACLSRNLITATRPTTKSPPRV